MRRVIFTLLGQINGTGHGRCFESDTFLVLVSLTTTFTLLEEHVKEFKELYVQMKLIIRNSWNFVSDMCSPMVPFIGVVYDGKWFVKGLGVHREVLSEAYSPETNTWTVANYGMVHGWRNPSVSMHGKLYALDCRDGCKLRVYDESTDSWNRCMDSKLHLGNSRALEAAGLVPLNGKLCIIRNNMSISMVDISNPDKHAESNPTIWENISSIGHFKTIFTNLWSSIA